MIYSILQSYLTVLLLVAGICLTLLIVGLYVIWKRATGCQLKARWHDTIDLSQQAPSKNVSSAQSLSDASYQLSSDVSCQRKLASSAQCEESIHPLSTPDITAIAGDDLMATQLDLARAYIETGKRQLAVAILEQVLAQGSEAEQQEARMLMQGQ